MRPSLLLLLLLAVAGTALGLEVMLRAPADAQRPPVVESTGRLAAVAGVPQGHVYTGIAEEPDDVNPYTANSNVVRRYVFAFTHDTLLDSDPATGALRGSLAETFERSPDGTSCVFTLRQGVRFADGSPLTMDDVLFGWELMRAGNVPIGGVGDALRRTASVDVLDERRFRVTFRDVHHAATNAVGEAWIVGRKQFFVDRVAALAQRDGVPAPVVGSAEFAQYFSRIRTECGPGTGPYRLDNAPDGGGTWRRRSDLVLVPNAFSWRRAANPGTWNFAGIRLLFRDSAAAMAALLAGELDWFSSPDVDAVLRAHPDLATRYEKVSYDYRTLGVFRVIWNCRRTPLDLPEVRRALGMLFDQDAVLAAFGGNGTKAKALAKPDSPEYPRDLEPPPYSPAEARRLLRESGFDPENGTALRLRVIAPAGLDALRRALDLFAGACRQAGVEIDLRVVDWSVFLAQKNALEWDGLAVQQMFRAWADPYDLVHTGGADNDGAWSNAEADELVERARAAMDPALRTDLLRRLHEIVLREQPAAFLLHPRVALLRSVKIRGSTTGPLGLVLEHAYYDSGPAPK